ncbi:MAG: dihydropteroate synthase [Candidatus Omnitrophica bacterium]|nr:dihydropteroate synthase [Candidatus Omnitrophota bacterium]
MTPKTKNPSRRTRNKFVVRAKNLHLVLGQETKIMGIVNATPDSFSADGLLNKKPNRAVSYALKLIKDGADIIDIGGESTRPGAKKISIKEELLRVIPIIETLSKKTNIPISIDTYKPEIAQAALEAGASIVNNVMGSKLTKSMLKVIKENDAAIILMHIRGTPRTMQKRISYKNLVQEIVLDLKKSIEKCLEIGIKSDRIIVDPGIGFGKTVEDNLEIIQRLSEFKALKKTILIGTSRKSFIGKTLKKDVSDRLMGSAASVSASILNGAHIVRVHDVKQMREVADLTDAIINVKNNRAK